MGFFVVPKLFLRFDSSGCLFLVCCLVRFVFWCLDWVSAWEW